jgi:hypothetical protein
MDAWSKRCDACITDLALFNTLFIRALTDDPLVTATGAELRCLFASDAACDGFNAVVFPQMPEFNACLGVVGVNRDNCTALLISQCTLGQQHVADCCESWRAEVETAPAASPMVYE